MTKAPKKGDTRAKALAAMTKPELIKTIKALDARQTKLLNELVEKDRLLSVRQRQTSYVPEGVQHATPVPPHASFPWEKK